MNICFISREYPPEQSFGGIGTHVYNLSHGMAENGHDVDVICLTHLKERTYADGAVRVHRTKPISIVFKVLGLILAKASGLKAS